MWLRIVHNKDNFPVRKLPLGLRLESLRLIKNRHVVDRTLMHIIVHQAMVGDGSGDLDCQPSCTVLELGCALPAWRSRFGPAQPQIDAEFIPVADQEARIAFILPFKQTTNKFVGKQ